MYIVLEGLDGTGKTTLLEALEKYLVEQGKTCFSVVDFSRLNNRLPNPTDVFKGVAMQDADVIFTAEPTHAEVGGIIRTELIAINQRTYNPLTIAHAYGLDREIHFRKIVGPALQKNKLVVQSRSWISSLVFQQAASQEIDLDELLAIPANQLVANTPPDAFLYTRVKQPELIIERMKGRDYDQFENLDFQEKIFAGFESDWLQNYLTQQNLRWEVVDVSGDVESGIKNFLKAFKSVVTHT